ncbi:retrotransposon protein, putative, ty1-copia subclass [Tanacetum coccineum]
MHSMGKSIVELHAMLKLHEKGILKKAETLVVLAIREGNLDEELAIYQDELKKRKSASIASTLWSFEKQEVETLELLVFPIRRSARIPQAPDRYGFYVDVEEYELGDLDEPPNYKAALSDPEETFSPVADIRAIRILLAIATFYDREIWQMDVKTTFLDGHLSKDIYMVQPKGFVDPKYPNRVCKLQRSIYGLKQASRTKCFSMKDLGEATYILGIKIIRNRSKRLIALSQSAYLEKTLKKFRMENSRKGYTPMIEKSNYKKSQGAKTPSEVQRMRKVPYASAIGLIIEIYWTVVKTILKYLRNTKDMVLVFGKKPEAKLKVSSYVDTSFQTDKDDTKSQTGYLGYIAAAEASMEVVWMMKFIDGLGMFMPSEI